ncbi:hypothetical protein FI667_g47, partial [Globisporangium splendens]
MAIASSGLVSLSCIEPTLFLCKSGGLWLGAGRKKRTLLRWAGAIVVPVVVDLNSRLRVLDHRSKSRFEIGGLFLCDLQLRGLEVIRLAPVIAVHYEGICGPNKPNRCTGELHIQQTIALGYAQHLKLAGCENVRQMLCEVRIVFPTLLNFTLVWIPFSTERKLQVAVFSSAIVCVKAISRNAGANELQLEGTLLSRPALPSVLTGSQLAAMTVLSNWEERLEHLGLVPRDEFVTTHNLCKRTKWPAKQRSKLTDDCNAFSLAMESVQETKRKTLDRAHARQKTPISVEICMRFLTSWMDGYTLRKADKMHEVYPSSLEIRASLGMLKRNVNVPPLYTLGYT